jgi:hypothetical protein
MAYKKLNPAAPARAHAGLGTLISSAAIDPDNTTATRIINRLRRRFGLDASVASLIASLAGLGPQEAR